MEPCPPEYEPPPFHEGPPPVEAEVERPASLPDWDSVAAADHRRACGRGREYMNRIAERRERSRRAMLEFGGYADALDDAVGMLSAETAEQVAGDVREAAAGVGEDADALGVRYLRLERGLLQRSPELREAHLALTVGGGFLADTSYRPAPRQLRVQSPNDSRDQQHRRSLPPFLFLASPRTYSCPISVTLPTQSIPLQMQETKRACANLATIVGRD